MKLISMTDFVLEQLEIKQSSFEFRHAIRSYANFLKQPLKLEMFVTINEHGNIISEMYNGKVDDKNKTFAQLVNEYQIAKEKVLFEYHNDFKHWDESDVENSTIEDLTTDDLTYFLNESTIKKLGL